MSRQCHVSYLCYYSKSTQKAVIQPVQGGSPEKKAYALITYIVLFHTLAIPHTARQLEIPSSTQLLLSHLSVLPQSSYLSHSSFLSSDGQTEYI